MDQEENVVNIQMGDRYTSWRVDCYPVEYITQPTIFAKASPLACPLYKDKKASEYLERKGYLPNFIDQSEVTQ